MSTPFKQFNAIFSEEDLIVLAEAAKMTLENDYLGLALNLDLSDGYLLELQQKIEQFLDDEPEGFEGQDRENYTDTQDRENYTISED